MTGKNENDYDKAVRYKYCMVCKCSFEEEERIACHIPGCQPNEDGPCDAYEYDHSALCLQLQARNDYYKFKAEEELTSDEVEISVVETRKLKYFPLLKNKSLPEKLVLGKGKWNLFIGTILGLFGSYTLLLELAHYPDVNIFRLVILAFLFFAPCCWVLFHYYNKRKALQVDQSGIRMGKELVSWDDVYFTCFRKEWFKKENALYYYLIVSCLSGEEDKEIRIIWDMRNEELGHYLECFKEKYSPYL